MNTRPTAQPRRRAPRGLTFLETVCAAALLAIVALTVVGGINTLTSGQERFLHRLAAAEMANRLMLQYLDDQDSMPSSALPVAYQDKRFRWTLDESTVRLVPARPEVAQQRSANSNLSLDRFRAVTIRVWLSEESGGSYSMEPGTPFYTITRLVDPIADVYRNPDSGEALRKDPVKLQQYISQFSGGGRTQPKAPDRGPATKGTGK